METLKDYLGVWVQGTTKFYRLSPLLASDKYKLSWQWGEPPRSGQRVQRLILSAPEALRKINLKAINGYRLLEPYTGLYNDSALITLKDIKLKPAMKLHPSDPDDLSLFDWLAS